MPCFLSSFPLFSVPFDACLLLRFRFHCILEQKECLSDRQPMRKDFAFKRVLQGWLILCRTPKALKMAATVKFQSQSRCQLAAIAPDVLRRYVGRVRERLVQGLFTHPLMCLFQSVFENVPLKSKEAF